MGAAEAPLLFCFLKGGSHVAGESHRIAKCNANTEERDGDRNAGCLGHSDTQAGSSVLYFESKHSCTVTQKRTMGPGRLGGATGGCGDGG